MKGWMMKGWIEDEKKEQRMKGWIKDERMYRG